MDACTNPDILRVIYFLNIIIDIVKIVVPIGLIIFGLIDFSKAAISSDEKEQKKSGQLFIKRLLYGVLIFVIPWIVEVLMVTLGNLLGDNDTVNFTDCLENANGECIAQLEGFGNITECDVSSEFGECYLCLDNETITNKSGFTWGYNLEKDTSQKCVTMTEFTDKNDCLAQNNTLTQCYYCAASNKYHYGSKPSDTCLTPGGWVTKDNAFCTSQNNGSNNDNVTNGNNQCYVCAVGTSKFYKWSSDKPSDVCMAAAGWQIDYNITTEISCASE